MKLTMTLSDALLVLLLAERIHGSGEAIRRAAKNVIKKLPKSKRYTIFQIVDTKTPRQVIQHLAANLDDQSSLPHPATTHGITHRTCQWSP